MRVARQPARFRMGAVDVDVVDRGQHAVDEPVPQRPHPGAGRLHVLHGVQSRHGHRHRARDILRARSHIAFLPAAVQLRHARGVAAQQQRADSSGTAELVRGDTHRREPAGCEVHRDVADCLNGVTVHRDVELGGDRGELRDRHQGADLVVGPHHRDEGDIAGVLQRGAQVRSTDRTLLVDRQPRHLSALVLHEPLDRIEDGVMLDRGGDDSGPTRIGVAARPEDALDGEVVALRAACGEDHLGRARAQHFGQRFARLLEAPAGHPPRSVQRGCVADGSQHSRHGLDGLGAHRGGGGVVEIDRAWHRHNRSTIAVAAGSTAPRSRHQRVTLAAVGRRDQRSTVRPTSYGGLAARSQIPPIRSGQLQRLDVDVADGAPRGDHPPHRRQQ